MSYDTIQLSVVPYKHTKVRRNVKIRLIPFIAQDKSFHNPNLWDLPGLSDAKVTSGELYRFLLEKKNTGKASTNDDFKTAISHLLACCIVISVLKIRKSHS